jgi:filamentous hemagglutinin family protein
VTSPSWFFRALALCLVEWLVFVPSALANPQGGVVHGGKAVITGQGTPVVTVHQFSQDAVLSWQTFNIKHGETTNFQQPGANSVAVNRILDGQASTILGSLNATGRVYLINPNGIVFGPGSSVNAYALAAATSVKATQLAASSRDGFDPSAASAPGAKIVNQGQITAGSGGFVYLVAPEVKNGSDGVIVAPGGEIQLAAGATVYLTDRPDGTGLAIAYTAPGSPGGSAVNLGKLVSDAGFVKMRAALVRQQGLVEANSVREKDGKIELVADQGVELATGSVTEAHGGSEGTSSGGSIQVSSAGNAAVESGAVVDASGGAQGGRGGSIDVSAKGKVGLSGTFRVAASHGSKGGHVLVDPDQVEITGTQTIDGGNGSVSVEANQNITLDPGATVSLVDAVGTPTYGLYSGGDIVFGAGSQITDSSSPGTAQNHWNVQLIAGATPQDVSLSGNQVVTNPTLQGDTQHNPTAGGIYLSGATGTTPGSLQPQPPVTGTPTGLVSLTAGDLTVLAAGDVWLGNGGGLKDKTGKIDVEAGRDVRFAAAPPQTPDSTQDSVIENGSGPIRVVAGGSVILNANGNGDAAIRTVGIQDPNDPNQVTRTDGGSIVVWAQNGDVDAGNANRWLQPGPGIPQANLNAPGSSDVMPVVANGILGIGSQAGGNVTVVAGGNVLTGNAISTTLTGGTAGGGPADFSGGHIGVFGQPVVLKARTTATSNQILPNAPDSLLLVIAGGNITGNYVVRHGRGVFRAGYSLLPAVDPGSLDADTVAATAPGSAGSDLVRSAAANDPTNGPLTGWVGSLARPITFDLLFGQPTTDVNGVYHPSIDVLGANGDAVRTIESPSLVYPAQNLQVPSYSPNDSVSLDAETGDIALLGNENPGVATNDRVWILPPLLKVTTHDFTRGLESRGGDFVLLNDFLLFPTSTGGLTLDVAGQVRTANLAANGQALLEVIGHTVGAAEYASFTVPTGTRLYDPLTGLVYTPQDQMTFAPPTPAMPATGNVLFRIAPAYANRTVVIPQGTEVTDRAGHVYMVTQDTPVSPATEFSTGTVAFFASSAAGLPAIQAGTILQTPNGTQFKTTQAVPAPPTGFPGQREAIVNVVAVLPGVDAAADQLSLETPLAGVGFATNLRPTIRQPQFSVPVTSVGVGLAANEAFTNVVNTLLDPIPGVEGVGNPSTIGNGTDQLPFGQLGGVAPTVVAQLQGPIGELAAGHSLVFSDPSVLPKNVPPEDVQITTVENQISQTTVPAIFKKLQIVRNAEGVITSTRVDPDPTTLYVPKADETDTFWVSSAPRNSAAIIQSDASPAFDARTTRPSKIDYFKYYSGCRSGGLLTACQESLPGSNAPLVLGSGPTHAGDRTSAALSAQAHGGSAGNEAAFERVQFDLAQPATLNAAGTVGVVDLGLTTEHTSSTEQTLVDVPNGNASFGAGSMTLIDDELGHPVAVQVPGDATSGVKVQGPGSAEILVGVEPFAQADKDHDGVLTLQEFPSQNSAVFDSLDQPDEFGIKHGRLTASDAPFIPTGQGGTLALQSSASSGAALGIETTGNLPTLRLPAGGANLTVVAAGNILLQDAGYIGTLQGGSVTVSSVGGSILGGVPAPGTINKRGIVTLFAPSPPPGLDVAPVATSGGGPISVDAFGDINVGGLALATLSNSSITLDSRGGSVNAGVGQKFQVLPLTLNNQTSEIQVQYAGSGVSADGPLNIVAKKDIVIGAGITGTAITIHAEAIQEGSGTGSIQGETISVTANTITGNLSATQGITVSGNASGANLSSSSGLVTGAGAGVASNTGSGRASAENTVASNTAEERASYTGGMGGDSGGGLSGKRVVLIDVSSSPCTDQDCS